MSMNEQRADWIADAVSSFADETMGGEISEDTISDIVCNIGHYATRAFGLTKLQMLAIYENGIGSWIAENDSPEGDPESNAYVQLVVG